MGQKVTLGGDRIGSGNKQKVNLHNYEMSTFNLEQDWKSSMAPGILYPFLKLVGTNHDTFDIDLDSMIRTLPTKGPLYGSYKFQVDIFSCPMRLYQGILHNNPVGIGLKMNQVYLPKLELTTKAGPNAPKPKGANDYNCQINESALLKYLGFSGLGRHNSTVDGPLAVYKTIDLKRKINAIPALAYYDIFKCYYSNKQEENAYVITPEEVENNAAIFVDQNIVTNYREEGEYVTHQAEDMSGTWTPLPDAFWELEDDAIIYDNNLRYTLLAEYMTLDNVGIATCNIAESAITNLEVHSLKWMRDNGFIVIREFHPDQGSLVFDWTTKILTVATATHICIGNITDDQLTSAIKLTEFPLSNIDEMRNILLSENTLGSEVVIDQANYSDFFPYSALIATTTNGITWNAFESNGLVLKTYQSDLFNNWLETEMIDGENGISALSAITVDDNGQFTMDALNLAEKIYEVLNRIAVAGGTYEDWQEAVWGQGAIRKAETPMYMGGMSGEIMFQEVISNSDTKVDDDYQPLGSLGGRGLQASKNGGHNIHIKCEEPTYIIGICSITPRICYTQGNDWDLTDLDTFDDLHKPALDGIGFQDLPVEQMAWWDTIINQNARIGELGELFRHTAGKQTAWINYQTAVDKAFGDFARSEGKAFMALARNYEFNPEINDLDKYGKSDFEGIGPVMDVTTYIDPAKFNYAFAVSDLAAQNFWVQIHSKVIARRKMGAQQIPNL